MSPQYNVFERCELVDWLFSKCLPISYIYFTIWLMFELRTTKTTKTCAPNEFGRAKWRRTSVESKH